MKANPSNPNYIKMLTQEEETDLFLKWRETGNDRYLDIIINKHKPLIRRIARNLSGYENNIIDQEELVSEGYMAIVQAAKNFELEKGFRFSTYARNCIRGVMLGYIIRSTFAVNPCTSHEQKRLFFSLRREIAEHMKNGGEFEMTDEMAEKFAKDFGVTAKQVIEMNRMFRMPVESLNSVVASDGESEFTLEDTLPSEGSSPYDIIEGSNAEIFQSEIIEQAIKNSLDAREERIIRGQVLVSKKDMETLEVLGEELGISRERVRQIRNAAKNKMAVAIKSLMAERNLTRSDLFSDAA